MKITIASKLKINGNFFCYLVATVYDTSKIIMLCYCIDVVTSISSRSLAYSRSTSNIPHRLVSFK